MIKPSQGPLLENTQHWQETDIHVSFCRVPTLQERLFAVAGLFSFRNIWTFYTVKKYEQYVSKLQLMCCQLYNLSQSHIKGLPCLPFVPSVPRWGAGAFFSCWGRGGGGFTGTSLAVFSLLAHNGLIYRHMVSLFPMRYLCGKWNGFFCVY